MIADNRKISQRQFGRMVVMDWMAKAALLLPQFAGGVDGRTFLLSMLGGVLLAAAYAYLAGKLAGHMEQGFYFYIKERLGKGCAKTVLLFYFGYVFVNTVFLVRMFAILAANFLLPDTSSELLMAVLALVGMYLVSGGLEARARVSEILFSVLLYPLLFLLLCAAFSMDGSYLKPGSAQVSLLTAGHGLQVFTAFGGMGIFLFLVPAINEKQKIGKTLVKCVLVTGAAALALFVTAIGSFGESGMRSLPWPAVTLMSSAVIPGRFFQRWDVIYAALLLAALFPAVGAGIFYTRKLSGLFLEKEGEVSCLAVGLPIYAAALWCGSFETAARIFRVVSGCLCMPFLVLSLLIPAVIEYVRGAKFSKRRKRA